MRSLKEVERTQRRRRTRRTKVRSTRRQQGRTHWPPPPSGTRARWFGTGPGTRRKATTKAPSLRSRAGPSRCVRSSQSRTARTAKGRASWSSRATSPSETTTTPTSRTPRAKHRDPDPRPPRTPAPTARPDPGAGAARALECGDDPSLGRPARSPRPPTRASQPPLQSPPSSPRSHQRWRPSPPQLRDGDLGGGSTAPVARQPRPARVQQGSSLRLLSRKPASRRCRRQARRERVERRGPLRRGRTSVP